MAALIYLYRLPQTLLPLAAAFFVLTSTACVAPLRNDPAAAELLWQKAEDEYESRNFAAAAQSLALASEADPSDLTLAVRYGELLEITNNPSGAASVYQAAVQRAPQGDSLRLELLYRLALVQFLKLADTTAGNTTLTQLPATDPRRAILTAAQSLAQGDPRTALLEINRLCEHPLAQPLAARTAYIAALAYLKLGEKDQATAALFRAINLAGKSQIAFDIETIWVQLKGPTGH